MPLYDQALQHTFAVPFCLAQPDPPSPLASAATYHEQHAVCERIAMQESVARITVTLGCVCARGPLGTVHPYAAAVAESLLRK